MAIQNIRLYSQDLQKPIVIRQGDFTFNADNNGLVIYVDLYNGGDPATVSGSVAGAVICPDGSTVALEGSSTGNRVTVSINGDCLEIPGQIGVGIQIIDDTTKTTVFKAIYNNELLETGNPVDPGSRITLQIGNLIEDIDEAKTVLDSLSIATVAETQTYLGL